MILLALVIRSQSNLCMKYTCTTTIRSSSCSAGSSQVILENGQTKALADVQIGDRVMVNKHNTFEPIASFIHV